MFSLLLFLVGLAFIGRTFWQKHILKKYFKHEYFYWCVNFALTLLAVYLLFYAVVGLDIDERLFFN